MKVAEGFIERSKNKPSTVKDYLKMLYNQVLPVLSLYTLVNRLEWSYGGRQHVFSLKESIARRETLCAIKSSDNDQSYDSRSRHNGE